MIEISKLSDAAYKESNESFNEFEDGARVANSVSNGVETNQNLPK